MMLKTTTTTITTILALLAPVWPVSHVWAQQRMSSATKRALERGYDEIGTEFLISFEQHALKGAFAYEKGIIRRDPSAVLQIDDLYHAWYTRGIATKVVGFGSSDPNGKVYHNADENSIVRYEVSRPVLRDPGFKKPRQ